MPEELTADFCEMLGADPGIVRDIGGLDWTFSESKLNAIAWMEHLFLGRPFLWVEDDYGLAERERHFLEEQGLGGAWRCCNVTEDPHALRSLHRDLRSEYV